MHLFEIHENLKTMYAKALEVENHATKPVSSFLGVL